MVRDNERLPPGFDDDDSSQGQVRRVVIDDMSSQGSYLKKVNGFDDMQSQGSYMVRGANGPKDGAHIYNADDDESVNMLRQSEFSEQGKIMDGGSIHSSQIAELNEANK